MGKKLSTEKARLQAAGNDRMTDRLSQARLARAVGKMRACPKTKSYLQRICTSQSLSIFGGHILSAKGFLL